jgi:hypothetical protein
MVPKVSQEPATEPCIKPLESVHNLPLFTTNWMEQGPWEGNSRSVTLYILRLREPG